MRIRVESFDFDNCVFHPKYIKRIEQYDNKNNKESLAPLIEENQNLIEKVAGNAQAEQVILMVGSNRQSFLCDYGNSERNRTPSCFFAINQLRRVFTEKIPYASVKVDDYLLSDTYGRNPAGENFSRALEYYHNISSDYEFSDCVFDDSKLTILYAQMHKIASENPAASIVYNFYDDRYNPTNKLSKDPDILNKLAKFFNENQDLIPNNIQLCLYHYAGENITTIDTIQGLGAIDYNYQENVIELACYVVQDFRKYDGSLVDVLGCLLENRGKKLAQFKKQHQTDKKEFDDRQVVATSNYLSPTVPTAVMTGFQGAAYAMLAAGVVGFDKGIVGAAAAGFISGVLSKTIEIYWGPNLLNNLIPSPSTTAISIYSSMIGTGLTAILDIGGLHLSKILPTGHQDTQSMIGEHSVIYSSVLAGLSAYSFFKSR
ncbi:MAG: hypothetical protein KIT56_07205, partial [Gammaproteobacteria bacterium]|nr:hypothetical protein [Gammaproteobacteria bacterium]